MGIWGAALPAGDGVLLDPAAGVALRWSAEPGRQAAAEPEANDSGLCLYLCLCLGLEPAV